jgi:hypothetical protein
LIYNNWTEVQDRETYWQLIVTEGQDREESTDPTSLQCSTCNAEFSGAWALVQHCHQEHKMTIYKTVCEIVNI